jgi:hypothetical protein
VDELEGAGDGVDAGVAAAAGVLSDFVVVALVSLEELELSLDVDLDFLLSFL